MQTHWDAYYTKTTLILNPSPFALKVTESFLLPSKSNILDLGCGNGRDSYYFASKGHTVVGLDKFSQPDNEEGATFVKGDMSRAGDLLATTKTNVVYSRFSLHSIDQETEKKTLEGISTHLPKGGLFFVEARTVNDDLCGKGRQVGKYEFLGETSHSKAHYRRFMELEPFRKSLTDLGFTIIYAEESDEFAPYGNEKPVCLRVIARKD
jgi:tellurite methyltransferase